jgi:uncharacterized protein YjiS (DUF1127 family)|tara:strand:+ start:86 stop:250 length:165 start_codon:yes stop_codon:yes gene_type:complete
MFKTFSKWLEALNGSIQKSQQARADLWLLTHLTDRELKDIGIARHDIRRRMNGS